MGHTAAPGEPKHVRLLRVWGKCPFHSGTHPCLSQGAWGHPKSLLCICAPDSQGLSPLPESGGHKWTLSFRKVLNLLIVSVFLPPSLCFPVVLKNQNLQSTTE